MTTGKTHILVTGGAGFIGSALVGRLLEQNYSVIVLDNLSTGRIDNVEKYMGNNRYRFVRGDVRNSGLVRFLASDCTAIAHLAGCVGVLRNLSNYTESLRTHFEGTVNVCDSAAAFGCGVLYCSTSEVYGNSLLMKEGQGELPTGGSNNRWNYALGKSLGEALVQSYCIESNIAGVIVRPFNIIGYGQPEESGMVVPRFVMAALRGEPITVYGDGTQRRCFLDIQEAACALSMLLGHITKYSGEIFNLAGNEVISIYELAQLVKIMTASNSPIVFREYNDVFPSGFHEIYQRNPITERLAMATGFIPKRGVAEIVSRFAEQVQRKELIYNFTESKT